jgi:hypothetical protein
MHKPNIFGQPRKESHRVHLRRFVAKKKNIDFEEIIRSREARSGCVSWPDGHATTAGLCHLLRPRRGSTHRPRITTGLARSRQQHLTNHRQRPPQRHPVPAVAISSPNNERSSPPRVVQRLFAQPENHSWTTPTPTTPDHASRSSAARMLAVVHTR